MTDTYDASADGAADVAVIGMACRLPGADTPSEFWSLLRESREARTELGDAELAAAGVPAALIAHPDYVKAGMFLPHMELFDAGFFGFSPLDARIMDPQHRHFLECTWEALEDAGCDPARADCAIGVFAGSGHNAYLPYNLLSNPELVAEVGFFLLRHTGNDKDFLATRASYCFNLTGPSVNVQTACSTSLVAVHLAAQSLLNGECELAIAGGVTIELPHHRGYLYKDSEILSRDGHCRPFDASSGGTVFGSGVGVLVLKRLDDALADGDHIHAVIKASAVNNDGAGKVSYLAPSVDGQAAAVQEALAIGGIDPASVSYVECHGTGTQLGDPIEAAALAQAYGTAGTAAGPRAIGSVKSNIGHLDTAAGVASLIKVILSLQHRQLPATLHYQAPNPAIDFAGTGFMVNDRLRDWTGPAPLRAGVSSLGVGGTNAHLIVEEAPPREASGAGRALQLLPLSARSESALRRAGERLSLWLEDNPDANLADVAYTLATGRRAFRKRAFVIADDAGQALATLGANDRWPSADAPDAPRRVAFLFAGGGAQYPNMGRELYEREPVYRAAVDECLQLLRGVTDFDLRPLLYPDAGAEADAARALERPSRALPALFTTQYAQARLWQSWGVEPAALIGHSMGENTAACIAGVLSLRDGLGLVALRGKLFETVPAGGMLSVELDEAELLPLLGDTLSLAAVNAPGLTVASGPLPALAELERQLTEREIGYKRIHIDVAAHSTMLDEILKPFGDYLRSIRLQPPQLPFISNLTGDWITPEQATDPEYWVRHLRRTVRFADGVGKLLEGGGYALLEVGPGRTLSSLAGLHPARRADQPIIASLRHPDDNTPDLTHMLGALGQLWQAHGAIDWTRFYADQSRHKVSLPTYAFDHARHWVEPGATTGAAGESGRREALADWLYQPVWRRVAPPAVESLRGARVLVLAPEHGLAEPVLAALREQGAELRLLRGGDRLQLDQNDTRLRWREAGDYAEVAAALQQQSWQPTHVLHLLSLDVPAGVEAALDPAQRARVFDSLFHLAQAAGGEDWQGLRWLVVTPRLQQVGGEEIHSPLPALALGPVRVLPREFPSWSCRLLDIDPASQGVAGRIATELSAAGGGPAAGDPVIALRGQGRYVLDHQPCGDPVAVDRPALQADGVYLITGGTGGLGLAAAATLAAQAPVTLVLLARRALPERRYWPELIAAEAPEAAVLSRLQQIEAQGARIELAVGDVTSEADMRALSQRLRALGTLHGIIHTAGVIDDGPLLVKDMAQAERVLAPKLQGAIVLDRVFGGLPLDFFVLYSSTSAFAGLPGQIDYAAANAFLDSFAHWRGEQPGGRCQAVNWPAWRDAGMAAALARGDDGQRLPAGRPVAHPLLDRCIEDTDTRAVFATLFDVPGYWVLNEHRIKDGPALIPGSGFIELALAAYGERHPQSRAIRIADAAFLLPFMVGDEERKPLQVSLEQRGDDYDFVIGSHAFGEVIEHVRGAVRAGGALEQQLDVAAIRARCTAGEQSFDDPDHHPFLDFGQRWRVLRKVLRGQREALIELELPAAFTAETEAYRLHPAALDMATAGAQVIVEGYLPQHEFYVPIGYGELRLDGSFPARAYSHVRLGEGTGRDVISFDIDVCDERGRVFLQVVNFTLRRIGDPGALRQRQAEQAQETSPALKRTLELGIDASEGGAALLYLLQRPLPQVAVSPYRLDYLQRELLQSAAPPPEPPRHDPDADPELPAIEAVLCAHPAVAAAVVRSFLDEAGERRLVAYFLPDFDHYSTAGEIRRHAREQLPPAQLPQQFVELDELPRLGEAIDRNALRDPLAPVDTYIAPRSGTEKLLARIWQEVLGVDRVGLGDNFFDLGGHSLLSTRVIVQVNKKLGVRLDQATMVLNTLEQLAGEVDNRLGSTPAAAVAAPTTAPVETAPKSKGVFKSLFGRKS